MTFHKEAVRWIGAECARYRSSPPVVRSFCGQCGSPLAYEHDNSADEVDLYLGAFNEPDRFPARKHIYYGERVVWFDTVVIYPALRDQFQFGELPLTVNLSHQPSRRPPLGNSADHYPDSGSIKEVDFCRQDPRAGAETADHIQQRAVIHLQAGHYWAWARGSIRHDELGANCRGERDGGLASIAFSITEVLDLRATNALDHHPSPAAIRTHPAVFLASALAGGTNIFACPGSSGRGIVARIGCAVCAVRQFGLCSNPMLVCFPAHLALTVADSVRTTTDTFLPISRHVTSFRGLLPSWFG